MHKKKYFTLEIALKIFKIFSFFWILNKNIIFLLNLEYKHLTDRELFLQFFNIHSVYIKKFYMQNFIEMNYMSQT